MLYCFQNVPAVMMGYLRFKTLHGLWGVGYRTEGGGLYWEGLYRVQYRPVQPILYLGRIASVVIDYFDL